MKEKIFTLTKSVFASELISGSLYLFIGTTIGNVLAFLFNLFLVRNLTYAQYAEISALISLITLAVIPAQAILPTIVQFAGKYFAKKEEKEAARFFQQVSIKMGGVALCFFGGFLILSPILGNFLHIKNLLEIVLVGGVVAAVYLGITNSAYLQSLLHFQFLAFTTILSGILKLFLGITAISLGFGLVGVVWGYFLTFFLPFLVTFFPLKFLFTTRAKNRLNLPISEVMKYALPTAVAIFALSSFTSTDILLVKHFFPASEAGLYSGLSLIGRIIFYFSAPISSVMFPLVVKRFHQGKNTHTILYTSFLLVLLPSVGLTLFYFLFPKIAISVFLGQRYFSVTQYIGWFGLYLSLFSLLNVLTNFLLSIKKTQISWIIAGGALLQVVGIYIFHQSFGIIIGISLILSLVLFGILLLYYMNLDETKNKTT